jgi:hypothetical protein
MYIDYSNKPFSIVEITLKYINSVTVTAYNASQQARQCKGHSLTTAGIGVADVRKRHVTYRHIRRPRALSFFLSLPSLALDSCI